MRGNQSLDASIEMPSQREGPCESKARREGEGGTRSDDFQLPFQARVDLLNEIQISLSK